MAKVKNVLKSEKIVQCSFCIAEIGRNAVRAAGGKISIFPYPISGKYGIL